MDLYLTLTFVSFLIIAFLIKDAIQTRNDVRKKNLTVHLDKTKQNTKEDLTTELLLNLITHIAKFSKIENQINELKIQNEGIHEKLEDIQLCIAPYKYYADLNHKNSYESLSYYSSIYGVQNQHKISSISTINSEKKSLIKRANLSTNKKNNLVTYGN